MDKNRTMHPNALLIQQFYTAFQQKDYAKMVACYHSDLKFRDPVFKDLDYEQTLNMWKMLLERGKDLEIDFQVLNANDQEVEAKWNASYTFTSTGNKVYNQISAHFSIKDGKIIQHQDSFSMYRWSRQALGLMGWVLGWTSFLQQKIQKNAQHSLQKYMAKAAEK